MKGDAFRNVDVRYAIAVSNAKRIIRTNIRQDLLDPAADHRVLTGVDQRYFPGFGMFLENLHPVLTQVEGDIRLMKKIVREILLDHVTFVTEADDKLVDAMAAVDLHYVP